MGKQETHEIKDEVSFQVESIMLCFEDAQLSGIIGILKKQGYGMIYINVYNNKSGDLRFHEILKSWQGDPHDPPPSGLWEEGFCVP